MTYDLVPGWRRASAASPGSSARSPYRARSSGRTAAQGWISASDRSQLFTSTASRIRPSSRAGSGSLASARRSRPNGLPCNSARHRPRRAHGGIPAPATAPPACAPFRPAQHGIRQLEQGIPRAWQAPVELAAEPGKQSAITPVLDRVLQPRHTERHGHRPSSSSSSVEGTPKMMTRWPSVITATRQTRQVNPARQARHG